LSQATESQVAHESFSLTFEPHIAVDRIEAAIRSLAGELHPNLLPTLLPTIDARALESLKFVECLPEDLAVGILQRRLRDELAVGRVLGEGVRAVRVG
jgi:hypothetical protein